jgi:ectoine hydroxylase-related dioxygenase (phytanoyl-CoA dioxygenase family)
MFRLIQFKVIKKIMSVFQNKKINISKINRELREKGYSILNSRINEKLCDQYFDVIYSNLKVTKKEIKFHGKETKILYNLMNKSFVFFKLIFDKKINEICKNYFKVGAHSKDQNVYQFDNLCSRILEQPCKSQPLHIDSRIAGVYPPTSLHFFIYLSDVKDESGPTQIVPSSHKLNRFPKKKDEIKAKKIIGKKGTVIVVNSSTWHGSSIKKNHERRAILTLVYTRWFIRQQFAVPFSLPKTYIKKLSNKMKMILGFYNYSPVDEKDRITSRGKIKNYIFK